VTLPVFDLDARVVFNLAVAMSTALLVGLGPAFSTTRVDRPAT
jgi:hypothetical protein